MKYWLSRPDLTNGFITIQKLRLRSYRTQTLCVKTKVFNNIQCKKTYKLKYCAFCGERDIMEDENHFINECFCWDSARRKCYDEIRRITHRNIPEGMMLSDFFMSFSDKCYAPVDPRNRKSGNHYYFSSCVSSLNSLFNNIPEAIRVDMDLGEGQDGNQAFKEIFIHVVECINEMDKMRRRKIQEIEKGNWNYVKRRSEAYWAFYGYGICTSPSLHPELYPSEEEWELNAEDDSQVPNSCNQTRNTAMEIEETSVQNESPTRDNQKGSNRSQKRSQDKNGETSSSRKRRRNTR